MLSLICTGNSMNFLYLLFFFYGYCNAAFGPSNGAEGYYWRDYSGIVPNDAVPFSDDNGKTIYVGKALHVGPVNGKLIPGTIAPLEGRKMYYYWSDKVFEDNKNIQILCSQHFEGFRWIDVPDMDAFRYINTSVLVRGGFDTSYYLYVGKVHKHGKTVLGKVTLDKTYEGMGYVFNGEAGFTKTAFKILAYEETKMNVDIE